MLRFRFLVLSCQGTPVYLIYGFSRLERKMSLTTYNDVKAPDLMYGTAWKKDATTDLVRLAVETGFTAIDTANQIIHYNEERVGDALFFLKEKGIERDMLFLQTKFTSLGGQGGADNAPYDASADAATQVRQSMESSLKHLRTDYVDSYVLHGPEMRIGLTPYDLAVWSAMEELLAEGKTRSIGVSNVSAEQLELLLKHASKKPAFVQNRCFAVNGWDKPVRDICKRENIIYQGFSLLTANPQAIDHHFVRELADKHGATVPQVIFRFCTQIGMLPLTGTTRKEHMQQDLDCVKFDLSADDLERIESIVL